MTGTIAPSAPKAPNDLSTTGTPVKYGVSAQSGSGKLDRRQRRLARGGTQRHDMKRVAANDLSTNNPRGAVSKTFARE